MYDPGLIASNLEWACQTKFTGLFPHDRFPEYSLDDRQALLAQIRQTRDPETGQTIRTLTPEEDRFIASSKIRIGIDAPFFLETFCFIDEEGHGLRPLYPLWDSQRFVLDRLAQLERQQLRDDSPDGLLLNILKVRQCGISTLGMGLVAHRILTQPWTRALAGSDTEEQARYLFRMVERIYDHLPFFLKPEKIAPYNLGRELTLENRSSIKTAWGKTTRGALQDVGGKKGNIERGRSQPTDEPILTPKGWRRMGDIRVGDQVMGAQGRPTRVVGVFPQGIEPVYRVRFRDGSWTECSGDHLWQVTTLHRRWKGYPPFVRTTQDLLEGGLFWNTPSGPQAKWFIPVVQPVEFPVRHFVISPYILGVYLGDGSTRVGALQIAARDPEIKARVAAELPPGLYVGLKEYDFCWYIRRLGRKRSHLYLNELARLGLRNKYSHEKFIPVEYLIAPIADRIALLQGLLDTNGWAQKAEGRVCFCTTSERLALDLQALIESLGGIARLTKQPPKKAHTRANGQWIVGRHPSYRLSICLPLGICPFHLPRKVACLTPPQARKYFPSRSLIAIEQIGQKETQCLRVEAPDQLYVTRHCIVTHNTNSVVHISELATWDYPEQLDSSLLPGIPVNPKTLVLFESTAELAGDWWHRHWLATEEGEGRFHNLFIPWPVKYQSPAPTGWTPSEETIKVGAQIERDSPLWVGEVLKLTRDHLYWYESTRAYYAKKGQIGQLYKEYPSNPLECFMYAGRSVFTLEELEQIDQAARKMIDVWAVEPSREIAALRQMPESTGDAQQDLKVLGLKQDPRPPAPLAVRMPLRQAEIYPVPPGFGFRRLAGDELSSLPSLRHSVMAIWEYPRPRGPRAYVLGVDVGDGLGQDYSSISVIRVPTIEEPAEEVAQYVSNKIRPSQLAFVCDAIGRFYLDQDGIEALAAIELNNHGITVQDLLQLHLGYTSFYVWEVVDAADPSARYTKRIGWSTTTRTRPILIEKFHDAVTSIDPLTLLADFRLNSSLTRSELRHFITEGLLGEAEHARGQHDDCIFSSAIGYYVAHRLAGGEAEPIAERRRRRASLVRVAAQTGHPRDWRNSATTAEEADHALNSDTDEETDDPAGLYFDDRSRA